MHTHRHPHPRTRSCAVLVRGGSFKGVHGWGNVEVFFCVGTDAFFLEDNILFSSKFNFRIPSITLLVDTDVFFASGRCLLAAWTVRFSGSDVNLFPGESSIFPSDARGWVLGVCFYLCKGGRGLLLCGSLGVTPVRRREDTDGDGDSGVKVQIDQT